MVSQVQSKNFEDHKGHQQIVAGQRKSSHAYDIQQAKVLRNATSNQDEEYSVNTGGFLPSGFSTPNLAVSTDSILLSPTSTGLLLPTRKPTEQSSFAPASPSPTSPDLYLSTIDAPGSASETRMSCGSIQTITKTRVQFTTIYVIITKTATPSRASTTKTKDPGAHLTLGTTTIYLTSSASDITSVPSAHLALGTTSSTFSTSKVGTSDLNTGQHIETTLSHVNPHAGIGPLLPSPASQGEIVTVVRQTEAWPSSRTTLQWTATDSQGYVFVQTVTTEFPAETGVLETKVTLRPEQTLVAVPKIITTTRGGLTQVMETTTVDLEGHTTMSLYTTVVGGEIVLATGTYFLVTSLPPGYRVLTIPAVVATTEKGKAEMAQTVYTDAQGHLTTSSYTTTLNGTPTSRTVPLVTAVAVSREDNLVTLSAETSPLISESTKVIETTSTDSRGHPVTYSYTTVVDGTPTSATVLTITSTAISTSPNSTNSSGTQNAGGVGVLVYGLGPRDYILGAFLPTILAATIAYPFKLININTRLMQPFHELTIARELGGVSAEGSIFLRFYDWAGSLSLPRSVKLRQPVIVISDLLVLSAALLAPIAAETVSIHVPDGCQLTCYGRLGVSTIPGRILEALLATMMALLIAMIVSLNVFRWKTGVRHNPWGIAGMASLGVSPGIRDKIRKIPCNSSSSIKESMILEALSGSKYALDEYWVSSSPGSGSTRGYGIVVKPSTSDGAKKPGNDNEHGNDRNHISGDHKNKGTQPFTALTWWGRCILLFIFLCVLVIATYYETTMRDSGFERFMDSRGFGVRFFFTALAVIVGGCMETFFRSVAIIWPYQQLSKSALPAGHSILLSPPTNAFYGLYTAFRQGSLFLGAVSFAAILAELLLPVTLSHVPFSQLDTYETQVVCSWLSISILALMVLVILYSFLIQWPHMPVDPRTIAGAMFYVCDSWMLGTMEGMSTFGKKERDTIMRSQRLKYVFSRTEGVSGKQRMNVDFSEEKGEATVIIVRDEKVRYG
jgi:hypothetical protein